MEHHRFFKVAGVTFGNRQELIAGLGFTSIIEIKPEPENEHDPNAHAVIADDQHVGYVPRSEWSWFGPLFKQATEVKAEVWSFTGGTDDYPTRGLQIHLTLITPETESQHIFGDDQK